MKIGMKLIDLLDVADCYVSIKIDGGNEIILTIDMRELCTGQVIKMFSESFLQKDVYSIEPISNGVVVNIQAGENYD